MAMDEAKFGRPHAMLPGQVMELETTDPGFSTLLSSLGLGGLFVMVSLNGRQRRVRRHGVLVRVALVDAMRSREHLPTSVRARLVARERVVLCGPDRQRVARWRRQYDPDGEVPAMGWGDEPIVSGEAAGLPADLLAPRDDSDEAMRVEARRCATFGYCAARRRRLTYRTATTARWRACRRCSTAATQWRSPARAHPYGRMGGPRAGQGDPDNGCHCRPGAEGQPGLRRDPSSCSTAWWRPWGSGPTTAPATRAVRLALINPLPSLGVAPEYRAARRGQGTLTLTLTLALTYMTPTPT